MPFQPVSMDAIRSSNQRALAAHWNMLATDRRFPCFAAFQPQPKDHSPEQLIVWDVESGGETGGRRFRIRRLGLRAEETLGAGMIGKTMDEVVPPSLKPISLDGAHACAASGSAIYAIITTITKGHQVDCERLLLPFGEGGTVEQIVASLQLISFQGPIDRREITSDFEMRCSVSFAGSINSDWAVKNPEAVAAPKQPVLQAAPASASDSPAADKRQAARRKVFKTGKIYFGKSSEVCTVRDMSATGALIELADPANVPDQFKLVLEMESASRLCAAVWRKDRQIGVRFG